MVSLASLLAVAVLATLTTRPAAADREQSCERVEHGDNVYKQISEPSENVGDIIFFLGNFTSADDCSRACSANSTADDPCHSWTYFHLNFTRNVDFNHSIAGQCFGRHDDFWSPQFSFKTALTSGVNCDYPPSTLVPSPPPPNVHFSWDTVPVFFHSSNVTGPYNDDALRLIARFPIVTIEKYQGPDSGYEYPTNPYKCCEEDRIVKTLSRVKAVNPNVSGVFYYNMVLDFPQYRLHEQFSANSKWWLHDPNGNVVRVKGGTHKNNDLLVYDITQDDVAELFANACLNLTKTGAVDGCFVDRVVDGLPIDSMTSVKNAQMQLAHLKTMQKMQKALTAGPNGPLIGNHAYSMPGVNALMIESFSADENGIAQLQWAGVQGRIVEAHVSRLHGGCANETGLLNYLAAFLIGADRYAYFGCGTWFGTDTTLNSSWHSFYDKPLGAPLAKAVKSGDVYSRKFQSGTSVEFNVKTQLGNIDWSSGKV